MISNCILLMSWWSKSRNFGSIRNTHDFHAYLRIHKHIVHIQHIQVNADVFTRIRTYSRIFVHTYAFSQIRVHTHAYSCICAQITRTHEYSRIPTHIYCLRIRTYIHAYGRTHTYSHTHTHTHTHACVKIHEFSHKHAYSRTCAHKYTCIRTHFTYTYFWICKDSGLATRRRRDGQSRRHSGGCRIRPENANSGGGVPES